MRYTFSDMLSLVPEHYPLPASQITLTLCACCTCSAVILTPWGTVIQAPKKFANARNQTYQRLNRVTKTAGHTLSSPQTGTKLKSLLISGCNVLGCTPRGLFLLFPQIQPTAPHHHIFWPPVASTELWYKILSLGHYSCHLLVKNNSI